MLVFRILLLKALVDAFLWKQELYFQITDFHLKQNGNMQLRRLSALSGLMKTRHIKDYILGMAMH